MKKLSAFIAYLFSFVFVKVVNAQNDLNVNLGSTQGNNGIGASTSLGTIIKNATTTIFAIAAILVLAMLIWGGVEWVLSGGDKEKVANARKRIIASLIGLAIIALAFFIVSVFGQILHFNVLNNFTIPTLNQ